METMADPAASGARIRGCASPGTWDDGFRQPVAGSAVAVCRERRHGDDNGKRQPGWRRLVAENAAIATRTATGSRAGRGRWNNVTAAPPAQSAR